LSDVALSVFIIAFRMADWVLFRLLSWAGARHIGELSGVLRFSVFVQSTDWCTLKYFRYHPRLAPDNYIPMHSTSFLLADILLQTHPRQPKQRFHPFSKYNSPIVPLDLSGEQN
ncbi:MAG: hypothetical protein WAW76_05655, partial [Trichococcus flocculiformis]